MTLTIQTDKTKVIPSKTTFLLKTLPKTRKSHFLNPCRRSSARNESRSRSCHFKKNSSYITPGRESSVLMKPPVFSYHVRKLFTKIPTWYLKFIFSRNKKFYQKVWWDTLNAVLTSLLNFPPDVYNPSRNFHCSKNIVPLIAKPWVRGIQLWRTSKIFSRNPGIFRQKYQNDKFLLQQAKSFLLIVQTLWQSLLQFFSEILFAKYSSGQIEFIFRSPAEEKNFRSANSLHYWSKKKFLKFIHP